MDNTTAAVRKEQKAYFANAKEDTISPDMFVFVRSY